MSEPSYFDGIENIVPKHIYNFVKKIWNGGNVKLKNSNYLIYHNQNNGSLSEYCTKQESKLTYCVEKNPLYDTLSTPQNNGLDGYFKELNIDIIDKKPDILITKNDVIVEQNIIKEDEWLPVTKYQQIKIFTIYEIEYFFPTSFNTFFNNNINFFKEHFFVKFRDHYNIVFYPKNEFSLDVSTNPRQCTFSYFVNSFTSSNGTIKYFKTTEYKTQLEEWRKLLLSKENKDDNDIKKTLINLCFTWDFEDTYKMLQANSRYIIPRVLEEPPKRCCYY
jgi:hypothetical protein